jgi:hypothetical protein
LAVLAGRFLWLLEAMCRQQGIDVQEIDSMLDFWENKAAIEAKYRTMLVLALSKLEAIE